MPTDVTEVVQVLHCESPRRSSEGPPGEPTTRTGLRPTTVDGDDGERMHERYPGMETLGYPWVASTAAEHADVTPEVGRGNWLPNEARW